MRRAGQAHGRHWAAPPPLRAGITKTGDKMRAIEIQRNGSVICTAGFPGAISLTVHPNGDCETAGAGLSVYGVAELGADTTCTCGGSTT